MLLQEKMLLIFEEQPCKGSENQQPLQLNETFGNNHKLEISL